METAKDRRLHDRFTVDPMFSSVAVLPGGATEPCGGEHRSDDLGCDGHLYEISLGGMRFELDEALPRDACVRVAISLPGCTDPIRVDARVVRVFDAIDDPGPRRMVAQFETFADGAREALAKYLDQKWLRPAPVHPAGAGDEDQETCEVMIETNAAGSKGSKRRKSASAA